MKIVSVRMSEELWELLQDEALRAGTSASEFVRSACLVAVVYRQTRRGDDYGRIMERFGIDEDAAADAER